MADVEERAAREGGTTEVPPCIYEQYVAQALQLSPLQIVELDFPTAQAYLGYHQGQALARWAHEHQKDNDNG